MKKQLLNRVLKAMIKEFENQPKREPIPRLKGTYQYPDLKDQEDEDDRVFMRDKLLEHFK